MRLAVIALALVVSGCSSPEGKSNADDTTSNAEAVSIPAKPTLARGISDEELARAIGKECSTVSRSEFKGEAGGQVFYSAQCGADGYLVSIKADGSTSVLDCAFADKMDTPCWKPW